MKALYTLAALLLAANVAVAAPKKKTKKAADAPAAAATPAPKAADTSMPAHHEAPAAAPAPAHHETAAATHSAGNISEFHEHAMGGQLEVTPHIGYDTIKLNDQTGGGSQKLNGIRLGSEVEYGVMDRLSVGADLTYYTGKLTSDPAGATEPKVTGLEDIGLFARGSSEMGEGRLAYGLGLGIGMKGKIDANGDRNPSALLGMEHGSTGGLNIRPYVGYEMMAGPGTVGAQINYAWMGDRTIDVNGTDAKFKKGDTVGLAAFYEYAMSDMAKLGAALSYDMASSTQDDTGTSQNDKHNNLGVRVYAPISVATNMTLVPALQWTSVKFTDDTYTTKDGTALGVSAALRMMF